MRINKLQLYLILQEILHDSGFQRSLKRELYLIGLLITMHIGPLHCANCFHSRDRHNVPSGSDSRDPRNPGIPSASGQDIYLADVFVPR